MPDLDIRALRANVDSAMERVAAGEVLTITDNRRPIGKLRLPADSSVDGSSTELVANGFASWDGQKPQMPSVPGVAPFSLSDMVLQEREESVLRLLKGALVEPRAP